jgi:Na+/melibiose symporter-like transporter
VRESRSPKARRLDMGGVALITASLSLLLYPLVKGREAGWPAWMYASAAASALLLALFVRYERRVTGRGGYPRVELSLFHDRAFFTGLLAAVCFFSTTASFFLISTIFLQNGLGFSARDAGLTFGSFAIAFLGSSLGSVRVHPKLGSRTINLGAALMMCGLIALLWMARARGASLTGLELAPALMIYGTGQGFVMPNLISTVLINIKGHAAGSASGVLTTVQQCSFATGVAAIGTVFFNSLGGRTGVGVFVHALSTAFSVNICLLGATFLLILRIPRNPVNDAR